MFTGTEIESLMASLRITHAVWVPDSTLGQWESALAHSSRVQLVRVCREGEAWPLAAGLLLGGKLPILVMQTTGLYESGDALRNVLFDLKLPIYSIVGVRNWLVESSKDSAKTFAERIARAWGVDTQWIISPADKPKLIEHFNYCKEAKIPGIAMLAEGAQ